MNPSTLTICAAQNLVMKTKQLNPAAVISFNVPTLCKEPLFSSPFLFKELQAPYWAERQLFLGAFDVEYTQQKMIGGKNQLVEPPPAEHLCLAFQHIDKWAPARSSKRVIINCWDGKSRGAALALALMAYRRPQDSAESLVNDLLYMRPMAAPNRTIVAHADEILERKDSLLEVVDFHPSIVKNRAEIHDDPVRRNGFMAAPVAHGFSLTMDM